MAAILNLTTGIVFLKGWSGTVTGGTLLLGDGTVAAPSLAFANNTNMGLYRVGANAMGAVVNGGNQVVYGSSSLYMTAGMLFGWSSGDPGSVAADTVLARDAANTLAQRNGTSAQAVRWANTYTSTTSREDFTIDWILNANEAFVGTTKGSGGGTARGFALGTAGVRQFTLSTAGVLVGIVPAGGIGYGVGAGGAITQLTSRTTGVLLNTVSGDITLFSAAGSATAASFTVTNSSVAITDNIVINQKSGTNLYNTIVTTVGAGSFVVTFYTTGGVATDAPVFHFSVIKGVSS